MENKGWVKLWREQFTNWISERKPWCDGYAWCYLYAMANHRAGTVNFRNEYIPIKRGQFLTSKLKLQKIFGWTYRHVVNFLKALENDEMVTTRTTNRYIIITIINYERYQGQEEENGEQNEEQSKNRARTELERGNTNKNVKNVKNDKNICISIFNFWNSKEIIQHKKVTEKIKRVINGRLNEGYSESEIKQSIENYSKILKGNKYQWTYKWTLIDFLNRGFEKFKDWEAAHQNYLKDQQPQPQSPGYWEPPADREEAEFNPEKIRALRRNMGKIGKQQ